jgi:arylsulfatase A-like enzyme
MYIALNETDEWAHRNRYDRYLEMVAYVDRCLGRLWDTLQAVPEYRANTAVVVTADHGRGENLGDWTSHGSAVEGAGRIWLAALGPNRPPADRLAKRQRDILQMCLRMVGAVN